MALLLEDENTTCGSKEIPKMTGRLQARATSRRPGGSPPELSGKPKGRFLAEMNWWQRTPKEVLLAEGRCETDRHQTLLPQEKQKLDERFIFTVNKKGDDMGHCLKYHEEVLSNPT